MLFVMSLMTAPAYADVTHKLSSSVQLTVDAAATNVQRVGTTYSVSGCLLYTSPSPRDVEESRMPSSA